MTYRPLPDCVTIRKSNINGLGLHCVKHIVAGTEIGMSHFYWGEKLMRTPLGGFYNHSDDPNCKNVAGFWHQLPVKYLITTKPIKPGDELTAKYSLYKDFSDKWE